MTEPAYHVDSIGCITQSVWCAEEGLYIERIIGNVYEFSLPELKSMGIHLNTTF